MLQGKKILIGVTGSISAYKINFLVRFFVKSKAEVKVVATKSALDFVSTLTLSTLSKNPVLTDFVADQKSGVWNNHVELGEWADLFIIAPASANTIAKMANGVCDNLLLAVYLSCKCPVWFAPAMDLDMYQHPSTKNNIKTLQNYGNRLIPPGTGELASGLSGEGRLEEPEIIFKQVLNYFENKKQLQGITALVTAGPTFEFIDPVRFIGNPSSGKMGVSVALSLAEKGAKVTLVCGPSSVKINHVNISRVDVTSAQEMFQACLPFAKKTDVVVMAAAVADYTPVILHNEKVKKGANGLTVEFKKTEDILKYFGSNKGDNQILVGFAMETNDEVQNAQKKLIDKNVDLIVLNSLNEKGAGFQHDTNKVTFVSKEKIEALELKNKIEVAEDIVQKIIALKNIKDSK